MVGLFCGAGRVLSALRAFASRPAAGDCLSRAWLRDQQRQGHRIEFHGPRITFPIRPVHQQSPEWNRFALRRQAEQRRSA